MTNKPEEKRPDYASVFVGAVCVSLLGAMVMTGILMNGLGSSTGRGR